MMKEDFCRSVEVSEAGEPEEKTLLILLSNQYSNDEALDSAIGVYATAIRKEGWKPVLSKLPSSVTKFTEVDAIIENINPYATLIIGEDTPTACAGGIGDMDMCSPVPFSTTGGELAYDMYCDPENPSHCCVLNNFQIMNNPTGLLYPNSNEPYADKRIQIGNALVKFSRNRDTLSYGNNIIELLSDKGNMIEDESWWIESLSPLGTVTQHIDPEQLVVDSILDNDYKIVVTFGHASCKNVMVGWTASHIAEFWAYNHAQKVKTPMLLLDGCYTNGWTTRPDQLGQYILDPPYKGLSRLDAWFGHQVFDNPDLRIVVAGFLSRGGMQRDKDFISECPTPLSEGKSIAEAMHNKTFIGHSQHIFGDPTFHF